MGDCPRMKHEYTNYVCVKLCRSLGVFGWKGEKVGQKIVITDTKINPWYRLADKSMSMNRKLDWLEKSRWLMAAVDLRLLIKRSMNRRENPSNVCVRVSGSFGDNR